MQSMAECTQQKKLQPGLTGKEKGRFKWQRQQWTEQAALQNYPAAMAQVDSHLYAAVAQASNCNARSDRMNDL